VISNKYGFIFIHTPKAGGTSISTALHEDLEEECEVIFGDDGGYSSHFSFFNRFSVVAPLDRTCHVSTQRPDESF